jgi:hypothetical protein
MPQRKSVGGNAPDAFVCPGPASKETNITAAPAM